MSSTQLKKKKVSKKLKKSWRKHVNISDVEEFLEEKRLDERLGPSLDSIPNNEIFQVDSKSSNDLVSSKQRRKLAALRPLKCFSALRPYTNISDPISKRNHVRTKEERASDLTKKKQELKVMKRLAERSGRGNVSQISNGPKRGEFNQNLWENQNDIKSENWVEKITKKHNLRGVGILVKTAAKSKEQTKLPAIELPHPGMSYNPSFVDHQDLLQKVAEKEQKLIKEETHLNRVTRGMFSRVTEQKRDQDWLVDMSEGLPSKNISQNEEEADSDGEFKSVNPPVKNAKKTLKQKRKKREHLEQEKARKTLKMQKKKITDIHNIKKLVTGVEVLDQKQVAQREIRKKKKELTKNKTKVLNAVKYEEPDLEFNLGQEIAGNLKDLKTEGSLLIDRFRSMQKRNILAPTKRHTFKRGKVKKYTKPGHKDADWKKTVARSYK